MKKHNRSFLLGCLLLVAGLGLTSCTVNVAGDLNVNVDTGDITVDTTVDDNPSDSVDDDGESDNTDNTDSSDDGSATPTPEPDPVVTYSISFKSSSYEFEIDETLNLGGEITCTASDGSTTSYTLSVDNTNFSVINLNHTVSATQSGTATLTATCNQDTSVIATAQITATDLPEPEPNPDDDPEPDPETTVTTYKIGAYDEYNGSYYYLTNTNSGNYVSATTSWSSAADFTVTDAGDGYTLSTDKNGTTYYVYFNTSSTTSSNLSISTTSFTWLYDSDNNTFLTASSSGRFIAKRASATDMRCYSVTNINKTTGTDSTELYYAVHLYATEGVIAQPGTDNPGDTGGSGNTDDKSYTRTYTLDSSNSLPSDITSYSTGGFATETYNSYEFDIYRGVSLSNYFVKILAELGNANTASSMPGMLMNTTGFKDIAMIELTYNTATNSYKQKTKEVPHIYYGSTNAYEYTYDLSTSSNDKTITIETEGTDIQFFCLSTSYYDVSIKSLTIYYNSGNVSSYTTSSCGEGQYRIEPTRFSGTPIANSSTIRVPVDVTYNANGTYTVNEYRTLTYDTYDSAYSAKRTTNAYTDPVDVAAYYIAFGTYPCNYTTTSNYSTAYSVFGSSTRFYSYYTRTNGYATSVPYRSASYYELDIALTSNYTTSASKYSRGVGRLVCWTNGFTGYDTYPVVTYTDDHYHTFKEYYNDGTFGLNFNAEGKATRYVHGYPTTAKAS